MDQSCKDAQLQILLSQFDQKLLKHISECEHCWESFMNLGLNEKIARDVAIQQKQKLLSEAIDPARQGDHRMEQFHLLSSLDFTPYAKRLFLNYLSKIEQQRPQQESQWRRVLTRLEDTIYARLQKKRQEMANPNEAIHAEVMMAVLDEVGDPSHFLQAVPQSATVAPIRRLYRSTENKMFSGVCGGVGEYFRIDPIFMRILFVALAFAGGGSIPLYILLSFLIPKRRTPQPVFNTRESQVAVAYPPRPQSTAPTANPTQPRSAPPAFDAAGTSSLTFFGVIRKLVFGLLLVALFVGFYLPLLAVLGSLSIGCALMLFVPITPHGSGNLSLSIEQLGVPGIVAGGSLSLLFFSLFMLTLSFILQLHFKKRLLGKSFQAFFVVFVVMSIFSTVTSAGILLSRNQKEVRGIHTKTFTLPQGERTFKLHKAQFAFFKRSDVFVHAFTLQTKPAIQKVQVRVTLHARGQNSTSARQHLQNIQIQWPTTPGMYLPELRKRKEGGFHFSYVDITVTVPDTFAIDLRDSPIHSMTVTGRYKNVLTFHNRKELVLEQLQAPTIALWNHRGKSQLAHVKAKQFSLQNIRGKISGSYLRGHFHIYNQRGKIKLKLQDLALTTHTLRNEQGKVKLYLPSHNIPRLDIKQMEGRLRDQDIRGLSRSKAVLSIIENRGKIKLRAWSPPSMTAHSHSTTKPVTQQPRPTTRPTTHPTTRPTYTR